MSLKKHLILGAALIVCPFFQSISLAAQQNLTINYNIPNEDYDIKNIVEKTVFKIIEKDGKYIPALDININLGLQYNTSSFTDAKTNICKININYHDRKPLLLDRFTDDLQFILAHEIGHCILGKEVFHNSKFKWVIIEKDLDKFDRQIIEQTNLSINTLECKTCSFKVAPPIAVYHEIYADVYAINSLAVNEKNLQLILKLSKKRIDEFEKKPLSSFYASGFSMPTMLEYMGNTSHLNTIERVEKISQTGFIKYLEFMNENYFAKLTNRNKNHD